MLAIAFGAAWLQIAAQTASPAADIDPAILAKANAGDAAAEIQAGDACSRAHDYQQAVGWYTKAANQGNVTAELDLASLYRDGRGKLFARDMEQAVVWYRKAADQGEPRAQGALGMLYSLGQGVPQSDVEAYFWLDLAAAVKSPNQDQYAANRQNVGTHITQDELEEVQQREAQWKAKHPRPDTMQ
jgi:uncharacterized protein